MCSNKALPLDSANPYEYMVSIFIQTTIATPTPVDSVWQVPQTEALDFKGRSNPFFEVESLAINSFLRTAMFLLIVIYIITTSWQHVNLFGYVYVDEGGSDTVVWKALIKSRSFYKVKAKC